MNISSNLILGLIYPVVTHWAWAEGGWLLTGGLYDIDGQSVQIGYAVSIHNWAVTCYFQQCGILTSADSGEPVQPSFKLRNSKWCSVSSLTLLEYSSDKQRLWSDCAYVQADLRLCWSHIPHCWKLNYVHANDLSMRRYFPNTHAQMHAPIAH